MLTVLARATIRSTVIVWMMLAASAAFAQFTVPNGNGNASGAAAQPAPPPPDPLGRETPASMVAGFIAAAAEQDYDKAANYLDLSQEKDAWGPSVARQLQRVLDRGGIVFSRLQLNSEPQGNLDDGLGPDQEKIGLVRTEHGKVDLLAQRVDGKDGKIWLVSSKVVSDLPELSRTVVSSPLDRILPYPLRDDYRIVGVPLGYWLAVIVLAMLAYGLVWSVTEAAAWVVFRSRNRFADSRIRRVLHASALPIRLLLAAVVLRVSMVLSGVPIVARQYLAGITEFLGWIALSWIVWRVVDALAGFAIDQMTGRGRLSMLSAVTFIRRTIKFALVAFAVIAGLNSLGYNVTAGLAALGIGGIAIALGAQKTIEHLVGSLTLVTDQPIRVGDFCRFGETLGTVEDIGMRSTRIRTLDRTLVTVPNGQLAASQIENFSRRDKFWFHPILDLRYETTPDQMRGLLTTIRDFLLAHPDVDNDPPRVRLIGLGETSLRVEIFAYVHAINFDAFLAVQEDLILRLMELVEAAGTGFAFPSQTLYVTRDKGFSGPKASQPRDAARLPGPPGAPDRDPASPAQTHGLQERV
uniref:MscS Mechanosensitive ion channel n=1 Tax=Rhodopseudomonas palustris (strain BisA53) TaxID=316055 RepID=Q07RT2_RHOP5